MVAEADEKAKSRRVVVIDDNYDDVRTTALYLQSMGHRVDFAINGYAGFDVAKRFCPDVVFVDLRLPDIDGATVARQIRSEPDLKRVRVFAITGSVQQQDWDRALDAGCEQVFLKPVDPDILLKLLESV
jgi:CheY-like chemotaxis protein